MDCPISAAVGSAAYPESLEFSSCDVCKPCDTATFCLVCLSVVDSPHLDPVNYNKPLRHSGVPMLTRLQQLLPLVVGDEACSVCSTCIGLVVSIDELELQLSEQLCQLQRRHVQKAAQQDWQRAAEQVICAPVDEMQNPCTSAQDVDDPCPSEQDAGLGQSGELMKSEMEQNAAAVIDDKPQDNLICEGQEVKHSGGSLDHPDQDESVPATDLLENVTETDSSPLRATGDAAAQEYASEEEDELSDTDDPRTPTGTAAPLVSTAGDTGSPSRRQADLHRRSLAHLTVDRTQDRPYQCQICERRLRDRTTALRHVMSHLTDRPFTCPHCPRGFVRRSYLQAHLNRHAGRRPFVCHCGHAAVSAAALASHRKAHTAVKPVRCSQCDKRFRKRSDLVIHQRAHTGERPYRCETCKKAFSSASSLNAHARKHSTAWLRCDRCSKAFEDEVRLQAHRRAHDTKPFCCDQCGLQFTRATTLRRHQTRHAGPGAPAHRCTVCRRSFRLASALRDHQRVHTGEKPFECDECGQRFSLQTTLTTHKRRHTGEKPFRCSICPRAFAQATPLKRHMKTHRIESQPPPPPPPPPPLQPPPPQAPQRAESGPRVTQTVAVMSEQDAAPRPPTQTSLQQAQPSTTSLVTVIESFTPLPGDRGERGTLSEEGGAIESSVDGGAALDDGGGGGGGMFHELQPLAPTETHRCPFCSLEAGSREEMDRHVKTHLMEETGKQQQPDLAEWR